MYDVRFQPLIPTSSHPPLTHSRHPGGAEECPHVHPPVRGSRQSLLQLRGRGVEGGAHVRRLVHPHPRRVAILGRHPRERTAEIEQPPEVHQLRVQRSLRRGLLHDPLALGIRGERTGFGAGVVPDAEGHVARLRRRQLVVAAEGGGVVRGDGVADREANLVGERVRAQRSARLRRQLIGGDLSVRVDVLVLVLRTGVGLGRGREGGVGVHLTLEDLLDAREFKLATRGSKHERRAPLEPFFVVESGGGRE
mmetsp:Transcript_6971/g.31490  ORF Transcript_6971/g.31490 Transcript_6971/m.31490 type:complete len:251 (+) Transcript_6971:1020-1772(+)